MSKDLRYRDEEWLREQYVELGRSPAQIAEECGVKPRAIYYWVSKYDMSPRAKEFERISTLYENEEWLRKQYVELGKTRQEITDEYGISRTTLVRWLSRYGVKRAKNTSPYTNRDWLYRQCIELRKSRKRIARECNTDHGTIGRWACKYGIDLLIEKAAHEKSKYKNRDWMLLQYIELGKTQKQIAKECDVTKSTICSYLRVHNITHEEHMLGRARRLAEDMGGECLSNVFVSASAPMQWKCANSHIWITQYSSIQQKHWCPICAGTSRKTIQDVRELAESRGGKCLSDVYVNSKTKMSFECSCGFRWESNYSSISQGQWCPSCGNIQRGLSNRLSLQEAQDNAKAFGFTLLSCEYKGAIVKHLYRCKNNHEFEMTPHKIGQGRYCPYCDRPRRVGRLSRTIQDVQELAESRGGKCLSDSYNGVDSRILFECAEHHQWTTSYRSAAQGSWCKICSSKTNVQENKFRDTLEVITGYKFPSIWPDWLRNPETGYKLEIDGYNGELKLGFERNGRQHDKFDSFFHKNMADFESQQRRDAYKKRILSERGIFMLYPTYKLKEEDFHEFIVDAIRREPQRDGRGHKIR